MITSVYEFVVTVAKIRIIHENKKEIGTKNEK
jgi:hypothetical protein